MTIFVYILSFMIGRYNPVNVNVINNVFGALLVIIIAGIDEDDVFIVRPAFLEYNNVRRYFCSIE